MARLTTADEFRLEFVTPAGLRILSVLQQIASAQDRDLVLTAGTNGNHSGPGDPHTRGDAFDLRLLDRSPIQRQTLVGLIVAKLGPAFTVLYEMAEATPQTTEEHCHIQVKKGTVYPPQPPPSTP